MRRGRSARCPWISESEPWPGLLLTPFRFGTIMMAESYGEVSRCATTDHIRPAFVVHWVIGNSQPTV
jgi:hypothetical protein